MSKNLSICLINPRFQPSFWGREFALPLMPGDKRAWTVAGGLPVLASLVGRNHKVTIIDESVEDIDFATLAQYDIIGLTGMIVQRDRMLEILERLKPIKAKIVVGGPYVSIEEDFFTDHCDAIFVGEAETTWPAYIEAIATGQTPEYRHEQSEPTDMATVPRPRLDLIKHKHYMSASMQCEFCDIIVIFGRRPRVKTPEQVVTELDDIYRAGFSICFMVDDNFIGNKVAVKKMLPSIISWQEENGYPLVLSTEATLNLADDQELMDLMLRANFREVFIGIESPRAASLAETKKLQNIRGDTMADKLARIRDAGIVVSAGFIVGFDQDDAEIFQDQHDFITDTHIGQAALGVLMALPKTPLYTRLAKEGRLVESDALCNFEPKLLTRAQLEEGCTDILFKLYEPDAFFERIHKNTSVSTSFRKNRQAIAAFSNVSKSPLRRHVGNVLSSAIMAKRLGIDLAKAGKFTMFLRIYTRLFMRHNTGSSGLKLPVSGFLSLCILHWHHYQLTRPDTEGAERNFNNFNAAPLNPQLEPKA